MSTVLCEPSPIQSAVEKLKGQRSDAQQEYRALLDRLRSGGKVSEGDALTLVMAGKSEDDLSQDLEDSIARAADDEARQEAERIQRDLLPPARQKAAEVARDVQLTFHATRNFFAGFLRELEAKRAAATGYPGYLDSMARELASGRNLRDLQARRQGLETQRAELQQIEASGGWGGDGDRDLERGRRMELEIRRQRIQEARKPFVPRPVEHPQAIELKSLAEICSAAVGKLTPEQRGVMRSLAAELTAALK